uniref:L1 transposable element RRM domain-containing protein n=1 Tax=Xiphophorus couchianus TaxID=32473 RepID=A0A3B5LM95_9TELE
MELAQERMSLKEEIKVLLNELTNEINQRVSATINKTEEMGKLRDAIVQLLNDQKLLREKITDLEGPLGAQPPAGAPPRSTVVRFLKFNVKEQILRAVWKKPIYIQEKRIFFDHNYAENIQLKRREYAPVKKALKENAIRFQTPMAKMRVHFDSGMVIYSSAEEAALDLRRHFYRYLQV